MGYFVCLLPVSCSFHPQLFLPAMARTVEEELHEVVFGEAEDVSSLLIILGSMSTGQTATLTMPFSLLPFVAKMTFSRCCWHIPTSMSMRGTPVDKLSFLSVVEVAWWMLLSC